MELQHRLNNDNNTLYCIYSKEKIEIGEWYYIKKEVYNNEVILKTYKEKYKEFIDLDDEEDEIDQEVPDLYDTMGSTYESIYDSIDDEEK